MRVFSKKLQSLLDSYLMTDYLCIPIQAIKTARRLKIKPVKDSFGRSWYCTQVEEVTSKIKEEISSPYAYEACLNLQVADLLDSLGVPGDKVVKSSPEVAARIFRHAESVQVDSIKELSILLAQKVFTDVEQSIDLDDFYPAHYIESALAKSELRKLRKRVRYLCTKHSRLGSEGYFSGKYRINQYNHGKDIYRIADLAQEFLESIPDRYLCLETIRNTLDLAEVKYKEEYEDIEGFAAGTIRSIYKEIEEFMKGFTQR